MPHSAKPQQSDTRKNCRCFSSRRTNRRTKQDMTCSAVLFWPRACQFPAMKGVDNAAGWVRSCSQRPSAEIPPGRTSYLLNDCRSVALRIGVTGESFHCPLGRAGGGPLLTGLTRRGLGFSEAPLFLSEAVWLSSIFFRVFNTR